MFAGAGRLRPLLSPGAPSFLPGWGSTLLAGRARSTSGHLDRRLGWPAAPLRRLSFARRCRSELWAGPAPTFLAERAFPFFARSSRLHGQASAFAFLPFLSLSLPSLLALALSVSWRRRRRGPRATPRPSKSSAAIQARPQSSLPSPSPSP